MKIAHIVCRFPPYYSGMGTVVFETAVELAKRGHSVEVITPDYYEEQEIKPAEAEPEKTHAPSLQKDLDFVRRLEPTITYGNAARLPNLDKELEQFDLVHLHYPFFGTANLVRRWKVKNPLKPLVITYHMDTRAPGWIGLFFKLYSKYYLPKILKVADKIIASSFDYARASDAAAVFASNPLKWVELPFGVDTKRFCPAPIDSNFIAAQGLDPNLPTVLFVGGMDQAHFFKGVMVLLEAILLAKNAGSQVQAILVGDGELRAEYELKAQGLGVAQLVKFVGRVSDEDLPVFYQNADLVILPSTTVGEAFGMVLLEAYASGVPVVASDLPGVRTVAAEAGTIFAPGNPQELCRILFEYFQPEVDQGAWRAAARAVAENKFAWPLIVGKLEALYSELLNKTKK
ncbi:MAG: glycosyltransferase family 4 protein [Candidatus Magasanikbacteria bacterium]|nr:glycosyltransferase family 4 protein [Candidatus Magasanikbacteria bacterium]